MLDNYIRKKHDHQIRRNQTIEKRLIQKNIQKYEPTGLKNINAENSFLLDPGPGIEGRKKIKMCPQIFEECTTKARKKYDDYIFNANTMVKNSSY